MPAVAHLALPATLCRLQNDEELKRGSPATLTAANQLDCVACSAVQTQQSQRRCALLDSLTCLAAHIQTAQCCHAAHRPAGCCCACCARWGRPYWREGVEWMELLPEAESGVGGCMVL